MLRNGFFALLLTGTAATAACGADLAATEPSSIATPQPSRTEVKVTPPDGVTSIAPAAPASTSPPVASAPPPAAPEPPAGPCDNCRGYTTNELQAVLTKRAADTRPCYERALTNTPGVRATLTVEVRVGRDGSACDVQATPDPPVVPGLGECVAAEYKRGNFPHPANSSCVVARVPIQFTPQQ